MRTMKVDPLDLGWVKTHRKLLEHPRFKDGDWLKVWTACLLMATHKPYRVVFEGGEKVLQPGQFITSRKAMAAKTGVQESKVERLFTWLKTEHQIEQHGTPRNRLITVKNWEKYQGGEQLTEHAGERQVNNNRTTSEHKQEEEREDPKKDLLSGEGPAAGVVQEEGGTSNGSPGKIPNGRPPAPLKPPRAPDPIWDTICDLFSLQPVEISEKRRIGKVVSTLKKKSATPEKIRAVYAKMDGSLDWAPFSPEGLVKWYDQLSAADKPGPKATAAPVYVPGMR